MMTWANLLTLLRLLVIAPTTVAILIQSWWLAAAFFAGAVVTDVFDGKLARRYNQISPFGGLFDHATDALFVTLGCWAIAELDLINPILAWLIPLAFVQYMLDSKALAGVTLRMSTIGKSNGVAYYALMGTVIGTQALQWTLLQTPAQIAAWLLVATTVASMLDRGITLAQQQRHAPDD